MESENLESTGGEQLENKDQNPDVIDNALVAEGFVDIKPISPELAIEAEGIKKAADEKIGALEVGILNKKLETLYKHSEVLRNEYTNNLKLREWQRAKLREQIQNTDEESYDVKEQLENITSHQEEGDGGTNLRPLDEKKLITTEHQPVTESGSPNVIKKGHYEMSDKEVLIPIGPENQNGEPDNTSKETTTEEDKAKELPKSEIEKIESVDSKDLLIKELKNRNASLEVMFDNSEIANGKLLEKIRTLEQNHKEAQNQIQELTKKVDELIKKVELLSDTSSKKISKSKKIEQPELEPKDVKKEEEIETKDLTAEKVWGGLSEEEKKVAIKLYQDKKPEFTGGKINLPQYKTSFDRLDIKKDQAEIAKIGGVNVPSFDPNEFFKVPTAEDFSPDKPFKETETGTQVKSQLVHAMYQRGYGTRPIPGEQKRTIEATVEDFQNEEERLLGEYYGKLIEATKSAGLDINDPATTRVIREGMVTAKRSLEKHLVNNYGKKVNQERRSNRWLRWINFWNSDIAERKTIGGALDIIAMNGGNLENAYAAIKNMVGENCDGEKDYSNIISCMNAHVRRSIKKSLDTSITKTKNKQVGFYAPDDPKYDRYQTYRLLQQVYCEGMADEIRTAIAEEQEANGEEAVSPDRIVERILLLQNERLTTIEENVGSKRWRDAWNKLKAAALGAAIGGTLLLLLLNATNNAEAKDKVYEQPKSRIPKIEKVEKVEQPKPITSGVEQTEADSQTVVTPNKTDLGSNIVPETEIKADKQSDKPTSPKIFEVDLNGKDVELEVDTDKGRVTEVGSTPEELQDAHRAIADMITANIDKPATSLDANVPGGVNKNFITRLEKLQGNKSGTVRMGNLEKFINAWEALDSTARDRFNTLAMNEKINPLLSKSLEKAGFVGDLYGWAKHDLKDIQENLRLEDIE